jgi:hypothetical protein
MYGSQFHFEQTLNVKRLSTSLLAENASQPKSEKKKSNWLMFGLVILVLSSSTISFAGQSQPRLPGGNGNSSGR